jgi:hypothetical protein
MLIDPKPETEDTESFKRLNKQYLIPIANDLEKYYSMFACLPFRVVQEQIYVGDDQTRKAKFGKHASDHAWVPVPRPMEMGTFEIEPYLDDNGVKRIRVLDTKGEEVKTVAFSKLRRGPNVFDPGFDSECGALLPEYKIMERKRAIAMDIMEREAYPVVWMRQEIASSNAPNDEENKRMEEFSNLVKDQHGYPEEKPIHITENEGTVILPPRYNTTPYQPRPNLLVNEEALMRYFAQLVAATYQVPLKELIQEGNAMISHRSESAVDEDRAKICAANTVVADDIMEGIQYMYEQLFQVHNIPISFQMRPLVDIERLLMLHKAGMIDDDVLRSDSLAIVGIHPSRGTKGPLIRREPTDTKRDKGAKQKKYDEEEEGDTKKKSKKKRLASKEDEDEEEEDDKEKKDEKEEDKEKKKKKKLT